MDREARRYLTTPLVCEDCGTPAHSSISGGVQGHTMLCDACRDKRGKKPRKTAVAGYTRDEYALWRNDIAPKLNKMGQAWGDRVMEMLRHCTLMGHESGYRTNPLTGRRESFNDPVHGGLRVVRVAAGFPHQGAVIVEREDGVKFRLYLDSKGGTMTWRTQRMGSIDATAARKNVPLKSRDELAAEGLHVASDDYPELGDILWERPDLLESEPVTSSSTLMSMTSSRQDYTETPVSIRREAVTPKQLREQYGDPTRTGRVPPSQRTPQYKDGNPFPNPQTAQDLIDDPKSPWWWRKLVGPAVERFEKSRGLSYDIANAPSIDWCRFRRNSRCFLPRRLDDQATAEAGYPVWVPEDRGPCWRVAWKDQKVCSVAEPGPNSREPVVYPDATVPWNQGGQRIPQGARRMGAITPAKLYHFTSPVHLDMILSSGYLRLTESNIQMDGSGKRVVWLTDDPDPEQAVAWAGGRFKTQVRFTVSTIGLPAHKWTEWSAEQGIAPNWATALDRSGGGQSEHWWVVPATIPATRWLAVEMWNGYDWESVVNTSRKASLEIVAGWRDVQAKAKRLRDAGYVRIIANTGNTITAEVKGDTGLYQTAITRVPGTKQTALWTCGCSWNTYAWARSGRWKKFEGRMCSHALALVYQAQSEEMFGGEIREQRGKPSWRTSEPVSETRQRPGEWRLAMAASVAEHLAALEQRRVDIVTNPTIHPAEQARWVAALSRSAAVARTDLDALHRGVECVPDALAVYAAVGDPGSTVFVTPIPVVVHGVPHAVVEINTDTGYCTLEDGSVVDTFICEHPNFDPTAGLIPPTVVSGPESTLITEAAADEPDGVMVAFAPSLEMAETLAEATAKAGFVAIPAEQMHLTLAVAGSTTSVDPERLQVAVRSLSAQVQPVTGVIQGFGTFASDDGHVLWASVDIPDIQGYKVVTDTVLAANGMPIDTEHGFTPHITLAYSDTPITTLPDAAGIVGQTMTFNTIIAAHGGEWTHYDLIGTSGDVVSVERVASSRSRRPLTVQAAFDDRLGRCYELALKYVRLADGAKLVHGSIGGPNAQVNKSGAPRIGHAYAVNSDGSVYEPISEQTFSRAEFKRMFDGVDFVTYPADKALAIAARTGHWGPWDDEYLAVDEQWRAAFAKWKSRTAARKGDGVDTCKFCGSSALWGANFDKDGEYDENGEWDVLCEDCGKFQNRRNKRTAAVPTPEQALESNWGKSRYLCAAHAAGRTLPASADHPCEVCGATSWSKTAATTIAADSGEWRQVQPGVWFQDHREGWRVVYDRASMTDEARAQFEQKFGSSPFGWERYVNIFTTNIKDRNLSGKAKSLDEAKAKASKNPAGVDEQVARHNEQTNRFLTSSLDDDLAWLQANGGLDNLAVLTDDPEPALPRTEAEDADIDTDIDGEDNSPADEADEMFTLSVQKSGDPLAPGGSGLAWLMNGSSSGSSDIAAAAQQFLAKTAVKDFSPAEQAEIIAEGSDGVRAANLDLLQIEGTHYQALETTDQNDDDMASFLW